MVTALAVLALLVLCFFAYLRIMQTVLRRQTRKMLRISVEQIRTATGILLDKKFETLGKPRSATVAANVMNYLFAAEDADAKFLKENQTFVRETASKVLQDEQLREAVGIGMAAEIMYASAFEKRVLTTRGERILERANELGVDLPGPKDLGGDIGNREHVFTMLRFSSEFFTHAKVTSTVEPPG